MADDHTIFSSLLPLDEPEITLGQAVDAASQAFERSNLFFGHGTATAQDEAYWLLAEALGESPLQASLPSRQLNTAERQSINALVGRRIHERKPAAYLTGRTWFAGIELRVDERALIPRSPLAEWIQCGFYDLLPDVDAPRVLDLCTGGGAIAIACAMALPTSQVDASDLSADALALARENVQLHALESRLTLLQGSLFDPVSGRYELIVSNPPYVDARDISTMPEEFRHEPALGLVAGDDGLLLVRTILADAAAHLSEHGVLVVEVGNTAPAVEAEWPDVPFLWLEFESGGAGVFVLTRSELEAYASDFAV